jgi:tRNA(Arg) A34 adenosine deaminase TadA
MIRHLRCANEVAKRVLHFGCILVAPHNETIWMEQANVDAVNNAEFTLARTACTNFFLEYLWGCTLYTPFEPCVMCTGTLY